MFHDQVNFLLECKVSSAYEKMKIIHYICRIKNKLCDSLSNTAKIIDTIQQPFKNTTLNRLSIEQKLNMLNGILKNSGAHVILNNDRLKTVSPKSTTRVNVYFKILFNIVLQKQNNQATKRNKYPQSRKRRGKVLKQHNLLFKGIGESQNNYYVNKQDHKVSRYKIVMSNLQVKSRKQLHLQQQNSNVNNWRLSS